MTINVYSGIKKISCGGGGIIFINTLLSSVLGKTPRQCFEMKMGWGYMEDREFRNRLLRFNVERTLDFMQEFHHRWELAGLIAKGWIASAQIKAEKTLREK